MAILILPWGEEGRGGSVQEAEAACTGVLRRRCRSPARALGGAPRHGSHTCVAHHHEHVRGGLQDLVQRDGVGVIDLEVHVDLPHDQPHLFVRRDLAFADDFHRPGLPRAPAARPGETREGPHRRGVVGASTARNRSFVPQTCGGGRRWDKA